MDISIFLAKAFAIYFVIMGLIMLIRRKVFQEALTQLTNNRGSIFLIAIVTLILGIILVLFHPEFTKDWRSVITVLCWLTLLKGIVNLLIPEKMLLISQKLLANRVFYYIDGVIILALGVYLGYCGGLY